MPSHTPCTRCNRSCNRLDNQLHRYTQLYSNIVTWLLFCTIIIFEVTIANFKHLFPERYFEVFKTLFLFSQFWRLYCSLECTRNNCSTHDDVTSHILDSLAVLARPFPIHLSTEFGPYIEARCGGLRHRRLRGSCQFSVRRAAVQTTVNRCWCGAPAPCLLRLTDHCCKRCQSTTASTKASRCAITNSPVRAAEFVEERRPLLRLSAHACR